MVVQINYVLINTDTDCNTRIQSFTEYEDAYRSMETDYRRTMSALEMDEDETDDDTYIEKSSAQIYDKYGDTISWLIKKTFIQTPEMAAILEKYDAMITEAEKDSSFYKIKRSGEFICPCAEAKVNACYDNDKKYLYFAVCFMPFAKQNEFIPYETYKWCVEQGIKKVSDADEANRIVAKIDATASFVKE